MLNTEVERERQRWVLICRVAIEAAQRRLNKDAVEIIEKIIELGTK